MAGITLATAEEQLATWLAANTAVARGQEYEIQDGGMSRRLKRADAAEIRQQIVFWQGEIAALTVAAAGGRRRTRYVVPE